LIKHRFKITLLGEGAVGKTSLRRTYLGETFERDYTMTLGADFATKTIKIGEDDITIIIWDLAGQPRFSAVREGFYKGTRGALLVFDLTRPDSYEQLANWVRELLRNNNYKKVPLVLIGNKVDLRGSMYSTIPAEYGEKYAKALEGWSGYEIPYIETSAKYGDNVEKAFHILIKQIIKSTQTEVVESYLQGEL
jgi:Ras-related protein Rab-11A